MTLRPQSPSPWAFEGRRRGAVALLYGFPPKSPHPSSWEGPQEPLHRLRRGMRPLRRPGRPTGLKRRRREGEQGAGRAARGWPEWFSVRLPAAPRLAPDPELTAASSARQTDVWSQGTGASEPR